jgi:hypothetical protein
MECSAMVLVAFVSLRFLSLRFGSVRFVSFRFVGFDAQSAAACGSPRGSGTSVGIERRLKDFFSLGVFIIQKIFHKNTKNGPQTLIKIGVKNQIHNS